MKKFLIIAFIILFAAFVAAAWQGAYDRGVSDERNRIWEELQMCV